MPRDILGNLIPTEVPDYVIEGLKKNRDAYFTRPEIAKQCFDELNLFLYNNRINPNEYTFLEPSAGSGSFYNLLPPNRLGLDIEPMSPEIIKQDFMSWQPEPVTLYIAIGNPPFGKTGAMASLFFQRLKDCNCDIIAFILPTCFALRSIPERINSLGWFLHHQTELPFNAFMYPDGRDYGVQTYFQIWTRVKIKTEYNDVPECDAHMYSFCDNEGKEAGLDKYRIYGADVFLEQCFGDPAPKMYLKKEDIKSKGRRHYAIKFRNDNQRGIDYMLNLDWKEYCFPNTMGTNDIRFHHINKALVDGGFIKKYTTIFR